MLPLNTSVLKKVAVFEGGTEGSLSETVCFAANNVPPTAPLYRSVDNGLLSFISLQGGAPVFLLFVEALGCASPS